MPGSYGHQGDDMADEPLLSPHGGGHDTSRYGNPFSGTGDIGADAGDVGAAAGGHGQGVNEDEPLTLRYGAAPEGRMIRRLKTTKRVPYVFLSSELY